MGNPLSPLIAELFMSAMEMNLTERNLLPPVWHRYVDDVFAIVKKNEVQTILETLNNEYESIKFICEPENDGKLPFLDLELQKVNEKIEIAIYHKPTSTMRTITNDSFCPIQHKLAAYHSFIHRLCRVPLSIVNYMKEYEYIKKTALVNGYSVKMVENLIYKHSLKVKNSNLTTFFSQRENTQKQRVSMHFAPKITNKLKNKFRQHDYEIVYRSDNKLLNLLGTTKDKTPVLQKSGIYCYTCDECGRKYYGQTRRSIEVRFKDHCQCIRLNHPNKSAIAAHCLHDGHENVNIENLKLVRQVNDEKRLDAYEAYYIQRDVDCLNQDRGNIESPLFNLIQN